MKNDYDETIQEAAKKWLPSGYDWRLFKAQLWQESKLDPEAVSPAGAVGIGQVMPKTWTAWAKVAGFPGARRTDPVASIHVAACYMSYLIQEWSWPRPELDRYCLAMASYNAGIGNILKAQKMAGGPSLYRHIIAGLPPVTKRHSRETIQYVRKILGYYNQQVLGPITGPPA